MGMWKTRCGTLWHMLGSCVAAAEHFTLNVQESLKCYRVKVRMVTPGIHALHHFVNQNFHHTMLGPLPSFGGILVLWGDSPLKMAVCGPRVVYPPRFLRVRFHQCNFS